MTFFCVFPLYFPFKVAYPVQFKEVTEGGFMIIWKLIAAVSFVFCFILSSNSAVAALTS